MLSACGPDMAATLQAFRAEYWLWRSGWQNERAKTTRCKQLQVPHPTTTSKCTMLRHGVDKMSHNVCTVRAACPKYLYAWQQTDLLTRDLTAAKKLTRSVQPSLAVAYSVCTTAQSMTVVDILLFHRHTNKCTRNELTDRFS